MQTETVLWRDNDLNLLKNINEKEYLGWAVRQMIPCSWEKYSETEYFNSGYFIVFERESE